MIGEVGPIIAVGGCAAIASTAPGDYSCRRATTVIAAITVVRLDRVPVIATITVAGREHLSVIARDYRCSASVQP